MTLSAPEHQVQQCHKSIRRLSWIKNKWLICPQINWFSNKVSLWTSGATDVTKDSGDSEIKSMVSLPSKQHFQQCLIWTLDATECHKRLLWDSRIKNKYLIALKSDIVQQSFIWTSGAVQCHKRLRRLRNEEQRLIALKSTCSNKVSCSTWDFVGTCWFEGNESLFLNPESPESFVTNTHCTWCSNETLLDNVWFEGNEYLFLIPESHWWLLWHYCTWWSNETLLEMLIWGQWVFVLNSWVSDAFVTLVAPDVTNETLLRNVDLRANESFVLNSTESPTKSHCEHLFHLMFKWDFVETHVDLRAMSFCS